MSRGVLKVLGPVFLAAAVLIGFADSASAQSGVPVSAAVAQHAQASDIPAGVVSAMARQAAGDGTKVVQLPTGGYVVNVPGVDVHDGAAPDFTVGIGRGIYLYLTPAEQSAIITGGGVALAVLICAAFSVVTCAVASGMIAAASVYLDHNPICPGRMEVKYNGSFHVKCV